MLPNSSRSGPLTWAMNLLLPPECAWCQEPVGDHQRLCDACLTVLNHDYSCCQRCAMPLPEVVDRSDCIRCRDQGWRFQRVIALGPYRGRLREAIILIKKPAFESLAQVVGMLMAERMQQQQVQIDAVLPVPNHWTRRWAHRTSTAETLATSIARQLKQPLLLTVAQRVKRTQKQGMLAWSARPSNVQQAFRIRRPRAVAGKRILVVDDVFTSGATAAELTRSLLKAGAQQVTIAVAARGTGSRQG